ncbi:MAG: hypothetical protein DMF63_12250 [Acidobacteria bacterium]|nr:MAG: hypothetical protein DMF63_12250 [Acidobacteriota bacterium]
MTGISKDWLVVIAFFIGFFVFTTAETIWINRRTDSGFPRSLFVAFGSNVFAITIGYFGSFLIMGVILALVWDESIDQVPAKNTFLWTAVSAAILFPILLLGFVKRLLVKIARIERIERPRLYAFLAAFLFNVFVAIAPALVSYFV